MTLSKNVNRGFTLIELLIVVSIIATLLGILVPSLGMGRELAKKASCASNLSCLVKANYLYAAENDRYFVPAADDIQGKNLHRWHGRRTNTNEAFDPETGPLKKYMGASAMKECPNFVAGIEYDNTPGQSSGFEAGCGGYGYNQSYIGGRYDKYGYSSEKIIVGGKKTYKYPAAETPARSDDIASPGNTVMFTDAAYLKNGALIAYSFCEAPFWEFGPNNPLVQKPNPTIHFRHLGQANIAWANGSVTSEPLSFTAGYQTTDAANEDAVKKANIGWFGPDSKEFFDLK